MHEQGCSTSTSTIIFCVRPQKEACERQHQARQLQTDKTDKTDPLCFTSLCKRYVPVILEWGHRHAASPPP